MGDLQAFFGIKLVVVALCLFVFGYGYNVLVEHFQKRTYAYTAELVVLGVLVTLLGAGFVVGWAAVLALLVCFVASGIWMIVGAMQRHAKDQAAAKKELMDGN